MKQRKLNITFKSLLYTFQVCLLGLSQFDLNSAELTSEFIQNQNLSCGGDEKHVSKLVKADEILVYNGGCCDYQDNNYQNSSYDQGCCYYSEPCQEACPQQSCSPCVEDECCERIEYVDHRPFEDGMNPGLYCLPTSTCAYSCPTKPSGAELYSKQGRLAHKLRYGSERSPEEWRTIMLHMRVLLPMTACSYRKILHFLQERPYKRQVDPVAAAMAKPSEAAALPVDLARKESVDKTSKAIAKKALKQNDLVADAFGDEDTGGDLEGAFANDEGADEAADISLEEMVGPIDSSGLQMMTAGSLGGSGAMPRFNHVFTGYMYLDYSVPTSSFFGDFNGDRSFSYAFAPIFLSSYGDHLLMCAKIAVFNFGQDALFTLPTAYMAYFFNDFLTVQAGKFVIPFGSYFNYYVGWCDRCGTAPLCRTFFEDFSIAPNVDIGIELKGAVPLCGLGSWFNSASLTYDAWAGNGPSEVNAFTKPEGRYPPGSIAYTSGQGNSPNNNNNTTFGGRMGFLPNDCTIFGFSYMKGQWNSNAVSFGTDPTHHLYFEGAAFDWTMNITRYVKLYGEYIWTQYENNGNLFVGDPPVNYPWVRNAAYWAAMSLDLGVLRCVLPSLYWCYPCMWDSLELVVRSEAVWSQPSGKTILWNFFGGYDYSGFEKRRFTVCLGYYFTETFTMKLNYDINYGETGDNFLYQFVTKTTKKTGFAQNVFTFRLIYGW